MCYGNEFLDACGLFVNAILSCCIPKYITLSRSILSTQQVESIHQKTDGFQRLYSFHLPRIYSDLSILDLTKVVGTWMEFQMLPILIVDPLRWSQRRLQSLPSSLIRRYHVLIPSPGMHQVLHLTARIRPRVVNPLHPYPFRLGEEAA